MKKFKKILAVLLVTAMSISMFAGCGDDVDAEAAAAARKTLEMKQNDYRGGLTRMEALRDSVLGVMETMKGNNVILRTENPNSFWSSEGYQDFVATFLNNQIISDTIWFNEEEGDWETTLQMMCTEKNSFTKMESGEYILAGDVIRNEKDDYTVTGIKGIFSLNAGKDVYEGNRTYRVLYDCDKDWCKGYALQTIDSSIPDVTADMVEYMRIDNNTFVIQTSRERLMVVLKPAETDTDIREREIKEFYYSKLVQEGMRTTFEPYEPLPEVDEATGLVLDDNIEQNEFMESFAGINESGDLSVYYGQKDSAFYNTPSEISPSNFIFEDKSLQQAICYKDGVLVVTSYNKLSEIYERFTYTVKDADKDGKIALQLEELVEINKLVGIQDLSNAVVDGSESGNDTTESNETASKDDVADNSDKS